MKNQDHSFTLLAIIVLAGLVAACLPASSSVQDKAETASSSVVDTGSTSANHTGISAKF